MQYVLRTKMLWMMATSPIYLWFYGFNTKVSHEACELNLCLSVSTSLTCTVKYLTCCGDCNHDLSLLDSQCCEEWYGFCHCSYVAIYVQDWSPCKVGALEPGSLEGSGVGLVLICFMMPYVTCLHLLAIASVQGDWSTGHVRDFLSARA
jgi:hypothetical protein